MISTDDFFSVLIIYIRDVRRGGGGGLGKSIPPLKIEMSEGGTGGTIFRSRE
jgi:hypothetical protein